MWAHLRGSSSTYKRMSSRDYTNSADIEENSGKTLQCLSRYSNLLNVLCTKVFRGSICNWETYQLLFSLTRVGPWFIFYLSRWLWALNVGKNKFKELEMEEEGYELTAFGIELLNFTVKKIKIKSAYHCIFSPIFILVNSISIHR